MKEFNLERALAGDPVATRDGEPVTIFTTKSNHLTHPIVGEVSTRVMGAFALRWALDGKYCSDGTSETLHDLFMAPVKRELWMNIYKNDCNYYLSGCHFPSEKHAQSATCDDELIQSILIREWEE